MPSASIAGSVGSNPLLPAGTLASAGTQTVDLTGLHGLGAINSPQGLTIVISISAYSAGTLTVALYGVSSSGYKYGSNANGYFAQTTALAATGTFMLSLAPGLGSVANQDFNGVVPNHAQIVATPASTPNFTYGIDYVLGV